ncbi:hypothetical protein CYLTODRAFT_86697 [Cylindrobasidium torrendii FP15055 ss-10]|uniref:Uncharacterized protein n=1 Tax=Cylindrobasidium torrendii FP15055 ss-10 TaxID=1314674 RepID=A0A0D7BNY8_9AGAR|nr:hypothetical protein CYLTODRAFT_86697 [Cylindrobasidium torrendii FP15055 ss-10]
MPRLPSILFLGAGVVLAAASALWQRTELGGLEKQLEEERRRQRDAKRAAEQTENDLQACRYELEQARRARNQLEEEARIVKKEVARLSETQALTMALLHSRTEELTAAEAYLNKADATSEAEIVDELDALNVEILQTAATMAETFTFGRSEGSEELRRAADNEVVNTLGTRMIDLLQKSTHNEDPLAVQIALQAVLCAYMEWIITSWYFEGKEGDTLLGDIYNAILETDQSIAGRWRALTRKYAVQTFAHGSSDIHQQLVDVVMENLVNVLISAGLDSDTEQISESVVAQFTGHTSEMVKRAAHLNWLMGQTITSCELAPLYLVPDNPFDEEFMEDTFGQGPENPDELILCTTDLGLARSERLADGNWQKLVLKKPRVTLLSGVNPPENVAETAKAQQGHAAELERRPEPSTEVSEFSM